MPGTSPRHARADPTPPRAAVGRTNALQRARESCAAHPPTPHRAGPRPHDAAAHEEPAAPADHPTPTSPYLTKAYRTPRESEDLRTQPGAIANHPPPPLLAVRANPRLAYLCACAPARHKQHGACMHAPCFASTQACTKPTTLMPSLPSMQKALSKRRKLATCEA